MAPIIHPSSLGKAGHGWRRSLGLDKDLDDTGFTFVERVVQFGHIFEGNPVCDHERRVELSGNYVVIENLAPVQMNGSWRRISPVEYCLWRANQVFNSPCPFPISLIPFSMTAPMFNPFVNPA